MNRRIRSWSTQLGQLLRRLEESSGRRLARKNAREDLRKLVGSIQRELFREFPNLTDEGKAVLHEIPLPEGQKACPLCGNYQGTYVRLADHILDKHGLKCPCGYMPKEIKKHDAGFFGSETGKFRASSFGGRQMVGHLRNVKEDLKTHLLVGAIGSQNSSAPAGFIRFSPGKNVIRILPVQKATV